MVEKLAPGTLYLWSVLFRSWTCSCDCRKLPTTAGTKAKTPTTPVWTRISLTTAQWGTKYNFCLRIMLLDFAGILTTQLFYKFQITSYLVRLKFVCVHIKWNIRYKAKYLPYLPIIITIYFRTLSVTLFLIVYYFKNH